jgi:hypothetical protein
MHRAFVLLALSACGGEPVAQTPMRFLHTFGAKETELFNATMLERRLAVESSLVPFARGQQVISEILRAGKNCPDLIRIDATWLAELVGEHLIVAPPPSIAQLDWTPEAAALAQLDSSWWSVPQTMDGLVVAHDAGMPAPSSPAIEDLVAAARTPLRRAGGVARRARPRLPDRCGRRLPVGAAVARQRTRAREHDRARRHPRSTGCDRRP